MKNSKLVHEALMEEIANRVDHFMEHFGTSRTKATHLLVRALRTELVINEINEQAEGLFGFPEPMSPIGPIGPTPTSTTIPSTTTP